MQNLKPVILTGDLNVAHKDDDTYNAAWKFTKKKACLTPEERESFSELLDSCGLVDAFRFFYPCKQISIDKFFTLKTLCLVAKGQFSYWSQRTLARSVNHGLRLDYFVASNRIFPPKLIDDDSNSSLCVKGETLESEDGNIHQDSSPAKSAVRTTVNTTNVGKTPWIYDSYYLHDDTVGCSDHCPVMLVLQLT